MAIRLPWMLVSLVKRLAKLAARSQGDVHNRTGRGHDSDIRVTGRNAENPLPDDKHAVRASGDSQGASKLNVETRTSKGDNPDRTAHRTLPDTIERRGLQRVEMAGSP